jgi:glycosyltransferase involved in cell wall biosynthesis
MDERDAHHRVSCVLPAYNEAGSLAATIAEWAAMLDRCTGDYEIIVVDDGSTDATPLLLRDLGARYQRLRVLTHGRNLGYGASIANGFAQAVHPLLLFTDADGQYEPEDFPLLLERIDTADVAVGYRLQRTEAGVRHVLSRGYNLFARWLVGVSLRDLNCAFKIMHRDAFQRLGIESTGFAINAELAMKARYAGMTLVEVPVRHRPRHAGRSTVRPVHVLYALWGLAYLRARRGRMPARTRSADAPRSSLHFERTPARQPPAR